MAKKKPFNESLGWKKFIAKLYGIGASIVIVGALFKIQHYPGAAAMLMIGLLTEAVIFAFSAFDPLPVEYHWQNVYPELLTDPDELEEEGGAPVSKSKLMGASAPTSDGKAFAELNKMIEDCAGKNVFQNLGQNFAKFNESVTDLKDVANSAAASKDFEANLRTATDSLKNASNAFSGIGSTVDDVNNAMSSAQAAINQVFELQLQEVDFEGMIKELKGAATGAQTYSSEVNKLSKNLAALNTVYGNMLTALNVKMA